MSAAWAAVVLVGLGTALLKGAGPLFFGGRAPGERLNRFLEALAPALLAALVATSTGADGGRLALDARAAGVAAAALLLMLRAPAVAAIAAAAAVAALLRAAG